MRKYLFALTVLLLMCFFPISTYAGPLAAESTETTSKTDVEFSITDGIDSEKKTESTFDESRTISGSAENGASVSINVYTKNANGALKEQSTYFIEVGTSGLFSQAVELSIGENVIKVNAQKDGYNAVNQEACIKRKSREIKTELENTVTIPGKSTTVKTPFFSIR